MTKANDASLVAAINRNVDIHKEVSDMMTKTQVTLSKDQISYMENRDANSLQVQRNMVDAISSIGRSLCHLATSKLGMDTSIQGESMASRMRGLFR
jgi:hypothetical protein